MSITNQQQNTLNTTKKVSPAKKNIKKHRELLGKQIKCKFCEEVTCYIYLEDFRYRIKCATCGYEGYLKELNTISN